MDLPIKGIMKQHAVLTAIGKDRVGIVDELTIMLLEYHCNLEESRMAVLGGEFAAILLVSGEVQDIGGLIRNVSTKSDQLSLNLAARSTSPYHPDPLSRPYQIESISLDTPGITHSITALLRKYGINIEDLETDTAAAPWTGAPMFSMRVRVNIPSSISLTRLRDEIDALAAEQDLDIKLTPLAFSPPE